MSRGQSTSSSAGTLPEVKGYWDRRPCNLRHSAKEVGTREYFDEVEARKYFVEPHIPEFADFGRWSGMKVLEIGCGLGTDSINFARAGADLTVIDLSDVSLELCRRRFDVYGLTAKFYAGNAEEMSSFLPQEKYDLVYSFGVIHHTPHPERVLREIKKVLAPDGELRIMLYSRWSWKVFWIILTQGKGAFWKADELVRMNSEAQSGSPVTFYYSFQQVRELLSGFSVERIWKDHIFPYRIDQYVNYRYVPLWYFRWMPNRLFRWLEHRIGWHTMAVARLNEVSDTR
ncbi:MAG TPA: class I SAM-dependent methyltransferase [Candidatus Solibacter sp.]|jgi:2-polyprenyl-3-methyl-5-hydroxy-6-metoxy-1,4-benzoquinol methylase|nr:class I SAM-dependent methyltransferase [Candidatus Solibacter sp.]